MKNKKVLPWIKACNYFVLLLLVVTILTFFSNSYWLFDLFSNFPVQYALFASILFVILLIARRIIVAFIAILVVVLNLITIYPFYLENKDIIVKEDKKSEEINILQFDVKNGERTIEEIYRWIISLSEELDVVIIQGINKEWNNYLERLKWLFPYNLTKITYANHETIILSKLLIDEVEIKNIPEVNANILVMRGETEENNFPLVIYAVDAYPPINKLFTSYRNNILMVAANSISKEKNNYKIMVGNFNLTPYSGVFDKIVSDSGLNDVNRLYGVVNSWPAFAPDIMRIPVDNMLISNDIKVVKRSVSNAYNADHMPIYTKLKFYKTDKEQKISDKDN